MLNNFSKNMIANQGEAKIAGNRPLSFNNDGGRRSLEEVRNDQMQAKTGINPSQGGTVFSSAARPKDMSNINFYNSRDRLDAMRHLNDNK